MRITDKIQKALKQNEAAIITSPVSCKYLSGFNISDAVILITKNKAVLFADSRYVEAARNNVSLLEVELLSGLKSVKELLDKEKITAAYVETDFITLDTFAAYRKALDIKLYKKSKITTLLRKNRAVKSKEEVKCIKSAQRIAEKAFLHVLDFIKIGVTEREIAVELEGFMKKNGAEDISFATIAVSGKNTSLPHGEPGEKRVESGDFVTLDFGAVVGGYHSDMTRTIAVGKITDEQRRVYNTVLEAQKAAIGAIKSGKKCAEIDKIARDIIANAGYGECFGHALGHSVGLEIHEAPNLSPKERASLKCGMVLTVEPGIYIENRFGVRIEDMVLVRRGGCENLTKATKELIVLEA